MSKIMTEVRKKFVVDDKTVQDFTDLIDGNVTIEDVERTDMSDEPGADTHIKAGEHEYKRWIKDAFNAHLNVDADEDEAF